MCKDLYTVLCAARRSGWTWQSPFWILAFASTVALNCQNTSQNACHGCEKRKKSNPIRIFLWRTKISEAVCKRDWHNVRSYLFFNVRKFRTQCAMALKTPNTFLLQLQNRTTSLFYLFLFYFFVKGVWPSLHVHFVNTDSVLLQRCRMLLMLEEKMSWEFFDIPWRISPHSAEHSVFSTGISYVWGRGGSSFPGSARAISGRE